MDLLCLRVPQRPRCPDLRLNHTAHKRFIQLEALTLDPQDEKIRIEVFRLYKRLLRLHEGLPEDFATLGRQFVQEEFKKHKDASQEQARMFTKE